MNEVRVLSLSTVFPRPGEENFGVFVRSRLQHMAKLLPVKVVSPVPWIDRESLRQKKSAIPSARQDGALEVFYPRWLYPPYGGYLNAWAMAARLLPPLRRLRRSYPFDVIDAHFGHPDGIAAGILGAALGIPFTITLRGNETMHAQSQWRKRGMQWAFRNAARLITVSESLRQFAISMGAAPERVHTIPNGIDIDLFYPRDYNETRARLGMPAGVPAILSAGYLIERKGHHRVVRALGELRRQGSRAELWIVGGPGREGEFEHQIHAEVREQGLEAAVHFTGAVKPAALAEYMSAADIFCLASSREGWPNVVHEALGCGAPAVACDVGGIPDMLPLPEYGIVTPAGDQQALTAGLGAALARQWDRDRIAAWGRARSWTQVAREAADVLVKAAGMPKRETELKCGF
jgi:glycosyltransferase involved in cell wall biosynthesis